MSPGQTAGPEEARCFRRAERQHAVRSVARSLSESPLPRGSSDTVHHEPAARMTLRQIGDLPRYGGKLRGDDNTILARRLDLPGPPAITTRRESPSCDGTSASAQCQQRLWLSERGPTPAPSRVAAPTRRDRNCHPKSWSLYFDEVVYRPVCRLSMSVETLDQAAEAEPCDKAFSLPVTEANFRERRGRR